MAQARAADGNSDEPQEDNGPTRTKSILPEKEVKDSPKRRGRSDPTEW